MGLFQHPVRSANRAPFHLRRKTLITIARLARLLPWHLQTGGTVPTLQVCVFLHLSPPVQQRRTQGAGAWWSSANCLRTVANRPSFCRHHGVSDWREGTRRAQWSGVVFRFLLTTQKEPDLWARKPTSRGYNERERMKFAGVSYSAMRTTNALRSKSRSSQNTA